MEAESLRALLAEVPAVICGDFSRVDTKSMSDYIQEICRIIDILEKKSLSPFSPRRTESIILVSKARDAVTRLTLQMRKKVIRKQPFGILIGGLPGCGKSFASMRLATELYNSKGVTIKSNQIVVLNEGDEFQSEFKTDHKIVVFDDLGATKVMVVSSDPFRKVIDFINNVPRTALNPNLDLKGNIWIDPDIVVATTNMRVPFVNGPYLNTDSIISPAAMARRFPLTIVQKGYDEFMIIDPSRRDAFNYSNLSSPNPSGKWINFEELKVLALEMYAKHDAEQESFVKLVTDELRMESLGGSLATFSTIIAFQSAVRYYISKLSYDDQIAEAAFLVAFRRFAAMPIQELKIGGRHTLEQMLRNNRYSTPELLDLITKFERGIRGGVSALLSLHELSRVEYMIDAVGVIAPLPLNWILRGAFNSLPFPTSNILYDLSTIIVPRIVKKIADRILYLDSMQNICSSVKDKMIDFKRNIYNKFPVIFHPFTFFQDIISIWKRIFTPLRPEGKKFPMNKLREIGISHERELNIKVGVKFKRNLPVPSGELSSLLSNFFGGSSSITDLLRGIGAMKCSDWTIVQKVAYTQGHLLLGPYVLAYNDKLDLLFIMRTTKRTTNIRFGEMMTFLKKLHKSTTIKVVFVAKAPKYFFVAPLFDEELPPNTVNNLMELLHFSFVSKLMGVISNKQKERVRIVESTFQNPI